MRRIILILTLLLCMHPVCANSYIRRTDDKIDQSSVARVESTGSSDGELNLSASEKTLNLYGWFTPDDSANARADSAMVSDLETRTTIGAPGSGEYLETLKIYTRSNNLGIKYATKLEGEAFGAEVSGYYDSAQVSGNTSDESVKINNLTLRLDGKAALENNIYYRVYYPGRGWCDWAVNGAPALGEELPGQIESLEIRILPISLAAPPANVDLGNLPILKLQAYQAYTKWTPVYIGKDITVDSEDDPRRIEAISFSTENPDLKINYQVLVADIGWTDLVDNDRVVGTMKQSRGLEAIKIILTGEGSENVDLYYRVKVQDYGWLDWANNGQSAGTENQGLSIEALQIRVLPKGSTLPGRSEQPYILAVERSEGELLKQINVLRQQKGLGLLNGDEKLHAAAKKRVEEVYVSFSHTRPNGSPYKSILDEVEYRDDGLEPAFGESIVQSSDTNRVYRTITTQQTCLKMALADYSQYFAYAFHPAPSENSVLFYTDSVSN